MMQKIINVCKTMVHAWDSAIKVYNAAIEKNTVIAFGGHI